MRYHVSEGDSAIALGSGDVPVLATPRLIASMEAATVDSAMAFLDAGETKHISIELDKYAVGYYDTSLPGWIAEEGTFEVMIGQNLLRQIAACPDDSGVSHTALCSAMDEEYEGEFLAWAN